MANTGLLRDAKHLIEKISVWLGVTVYLYAIILYYTIHDICNCYTKLFALAKILLFIQTFSVAIQLTKNASSANMARQ